MRRRRIEKLVIQSTCKPVKQDRSWRSIAEELTTKLTHDLHGDGKTRFGNENNKNVTRKADQFPKWPKSARTGLLLVINETKLN